MYEFIEFEPEVSAGVARITLNRPEVRNAQNRGMLVELGDAVRRVEADDAVRCLVLRGAGEVFSSGHDLGSSVARKEWAPGPEQHESFRVNGGTAAGAEQRLLQEWHYFYATTRQLRDTHKVTIAQTRGQVIAAGLMLMWACDLVVAGEGTRFVDPVGTAMGMCGVEYFAHPWELGPRRAKEMLLLGTPMAADEAQRIGMVNRVVPDAELDGCVDDMARRVAALPGITSKLIKLSVNQSMDAAGFSNALTGAFNLHQLNHAHWAEVSGGTSMVGPRTDVPTDPSSEPR